MMNKIKMESISPPESRLPDINEHSTLVTPSSGGGVGEQINLTTLVASVTVSTSVQQQPITLGVHTPTTPRIDISRASSSSYHEDSRDSSPENVFDQVIDFTSYVLYFFFEIIYIQMRIFFYRLVQVHYKNRVLVVFMRTALWI